MNNLGRPPNVKARMTFAEWWHDYRVKNGMGIPKKQEEAARAAWNACANQNVPAYVLLTLVAANKHTEELREAWQRGVIDERDVGHGNARCNRNFDVAFATRKALGMLQP